MRTGWKHAALRLFGHQHWIPHGRDWVLRRFHNPDTSPPIPFEVPFFGLRYRGDLSNFIDWSVYYYGAYSPNELFLLRDLAAALGGALKRRPYFFDMGANIGHHTLFMAPHASHVFAFEPYAPVRAAIEQKVAHNALANVTILPVGLGEADAELDFFEPDGANTGTGSFLAAGRTGNVSKLQVRRGDSFFASEALPAMELVKIDVEGFELPLLCGLRERIQSDRPLILMELSPETREAAGSEAGLRRHLYEGACIASVGCVNISSSYRLQPHCFEQDLEILIVPEEKLSLLPFEFPSQ